jgi:hypothetical protein
MIRRGFSLAILSFVAFSGCTTKQIYEATQPKYNEAECMKLPRSQYEECMQRKPLSYEDYENERKKNY